MPAVDTTLATTHAQFVATRPSGADEDVHMVPAIVDHIIERCSKPGDLVLDPFAGFGTTLIRAVALGRRALGIELLGERVAYLRQLVSATQIVEGDARELAQVLANVQFGSVDLVLSSPPYMTENHHEEDPLTGYELAGGDYARYLRELGLVAQQCARLLAPGGLLVWNVADICHLGHTTHLIRDVARVLEAHLCPVGITTIKWDRLPHDLVADALLIFRSVESPIAGTGG